MLRSESERYAIIREYIDNIQYNLDFLRFNISRINAEEFLKIGDANRNLHDARRSMVDRCPPNEVLEMVGLFYDVKDIADAEDSNE